MKTVIFDLDGTLADIGHRMPLVAGKRKHWNEFFLRCVDDQPIEPVIEMCNLLYRTGYRIRILSGRSAIVHTQTVEWLRQQGALSHAHDASPPTGSRIERDLVGCAAC